MIAEAEVCNSLNWKLMKTRTLVEESASQKKIKLEETAFDRKTHF
jgi:hypothetical protein